MSLEVMVEAMLGKGAVARYCHWRRKASCVGCRARGSAVRDEIGWCGCLDGNGGNIMLC